MDGLGPKALTWIYCKSFWTPAKKRAGKAREKEQKWNTKLHVFVPASFTGEQDVSNKKSLKHFKRKIKETRPETSWTRGQSFLEHVTSKHVWQCLPPFPQNKLPRETQYFFLLANKIWKKLALELGAEIGDGKRAFNAGLGKPIFNTSRGRKIDS